LKLDPSRATGSEIYQFMISVIVPRPIAFVSTVGEEGRFNAAPFSFFTGLASSPPLIGISINLRSGSPKDTLRNIRATGDFVVNVVTEEMLERVVKTSGEWPSDVDELELAELTPIPSEQVKAPRVQESPVHLECRIYREVELDKTFFVIGKIMLAHVAERVITDGRVDVTKLRPAARLGGAGYARLGEILSIPRPVVERPPQSG
jgi:flavin reductase (DIM6/NTAB) family NADH-FMN oxidoreductase RutF